MKKQRHVWLSFCLFLLLTACVGQPEPVKTVTQFLVAYNESDFAKAAEVLADSVICQEGSFTYAANKEETYRIFQWDSVFHPTYELVAFEKLGDDTYKAILSKTCDRVRFLHDDPIVSTTIFTIRNQTIERLSTPDYEVFDTEKWNRRLTELTSWIEVYHPELKGFERDLTPQGAQNFLSAIAYYTAQDTTAHP